MGGSGEGGRRGSLISDEDLLRTIGEDLRSFYADIIRQPLPPRIEAALARIDQAQHQGWNVSRPGVQWATTAGGFSPPAPRATRQNPTRRFSRPDTAPLLQESLQPRLDLAEPSLA